MPYLLIQTNQDVDSQASRKLLTKISNHVSKLLGKPESYVMVTLQAGSAMLFSGTDAPLAYMELKSIGLPESKTKELSQALCELVHSELNIAKNRVYIEFNNAAGHMWGWNGDTF